MSIPGLRQPKLAIKVLNNTKYVPSDQKYTILTLKNGMKLVVSCDSYNGIIMMGDMFKCVLCDKEIELETSKKENHKKLIEHKRCLQRYPHLEDLSENLIRQMVKNEVSPTEELLRNAKLIQNKSAYSFGLIADKTKKNVLFQIDKTTCYCTICNVITLPVTLTRHIVSEQHVSELNKAIKRAEAYTPLDNN